MGEGTVVSGSLFGSVPKLFRGIRGVGSVITVSSDSFPDPEGKANQPYLRWVGTGVVVTSVTFLRPKVKVGCHGFLRGRGDHSTVSSG